MSTVTLTVGIPASGKSTFAREHCASTGAVLVCRDDIRLMQGLKHGENENKVTQVAQALIEGAILDGLDVMVADTNLNLKFRNKLIKFCHQRGADVEIMTFPVGLDEAIRRDFGRVDKVGPDVIKRFHDQYVQQNPKDELLPVPSYEPYKHQSETFFDGADESEYLTKHPVICVDIDGTVARHVNRSPYDYTKVLDDEPIMDVIRVVSDLSYYHKIIFVSGRDDSCESDTRTWLNKYFAPDRYVLLMRKTGDQRPDYIIKNEIYDAKIIPNYNVIMVFDDRDQVVLHLRRRGITVAQVNYGRF